MHRVAAGIALLCGVSNAPASAVSIDWVPVGGAGNAADTGLGAVAYAYRIAKYEVTNSQYAEFLNAVAAADPLGLYSASMASGLGGISQNGAPGSYAYTAIAGREQMPVNFVTFHDALRFANWLHNGQPVGAQGITTTEDGAYTLTADGIAANSILRNPGAEIFLPSEDEWYKAAYYDVATASYFEYPAAMAAQTLCAAASATPNTANCGNAVGDLTAVGSYAASASPNDTFDQGGNVREWNEAVFGGTNRGVRGGGFGNSPNQLAAAGQSNTDPSFDRVNLGFRVASVPEPGTGLLLTAGLLVLTRRRRRRR